MSEINYLINAQTNAEEKILSFVGSQDGILADTIARISKNKALITWAYLKHNQIEIFNTTAKTNTAIL